MAISEFLDPNYVKSRLDSFTFSGDNLQVEVFGGTLVASDISEIRSGTLNVIQNVQALEDIRGGTIDTITNVVDIAQASGLSVGATLATDNVGLFRQGGTVGQVTSIQNALPSGTNRLGGVRLLDTNDAGFDSLDQVVAGGTKNTMTTVPSVGGDLVNQPVHDSVTAGTAVSSISYSNPVKVIKAVNKGGNTIYLQINDPTGGTVVAEENEGRRLVWSGINTLYYKTPNTPTADLDLEAWS